MAITKRRRRLPSGVKEIVSRPGVIVDNRKLNSAELVIDSVGAGQPVAAQAVLPSGAKVVGYSYVTGPAWTSTTVVLDLGDIADAARYYSDKNVKAVGTEFISVDPGVEYPMGDTITAAITTTGGVATGAKTRVRVFYLA